MVVRWIRGGAAGVVAGSRAAAATATVRRAHCWVAGAPADMRASLCHRRTRASRPRRGPARRSRGGRRTRTQERGGGFRRPARPFPHSQAACAGGRDGCARRRWRGRPAAAAVAAWLGRGREGAGGAGRSTGTCRSTRRVAGAPRGHRTVGVGVAVAAAPAVIPCALCRYTERVRAEGEGWKAAQPFSASWTLADCARTLFFVLCPRRRRCV